MERVVADLQKGLNLALISDAGTPLIADPGFALVRCCREKNIPVTAVPGANAALTALSLSGFPPLPFQVLGFLPKKMGELSTALTRALLYQGTTICFEAPHRLIDTLFALEKLAPSRLLCVARELTKMHEECRVHTPSALLAHFKQSPPRGEIVLLIAPPEKRVLFEGYTPRECVAYLEAEFSLNTREAIKLAAELLHIPKKIVYKDMLALDKFIC